MSLPTVTLGVGGFQTTPLGFGCASLFRIPSPAQRAHILHAAYDAGIRHFDVAPMYGLGRAESELGTFARVRRDELTIATKFGIRPTLIARGLARVQGPIRRVFEAKPAVRDHARAPAGPSGHLYEQGGYHAAGARRSLERSLRALKTDYVDLFLLHDPLPGSVRSGEVSSFLEDARAAGLIRSWGIAGEPESTGEVARSFHGDVPIRQLRDDIFLRSLHCMPTGAAYITYGVILRALTRLAQHVRADDSRRLRWKRTIGADCGDPDIAASFLLRAAVQGNSSGVVLFSTNNPARIHSAAATLEMFHSSEDPALDAFLRIVDSELRKIPDI
jgi:diketogulonate reductase-like aldo/keto reductase